MANRVVATDVLEPEGPVCLDDGQVYLVEMAKARACVSRIDTKGKRAKFKTMVDTALDCDGVVLIAWQHQEIPAIGAHLLKHTGTTGIVLPTSWPEDRYDLVWVFDRPTGSGPITAFTQVPQLLLAGDRDSVLPVS